MPRPAHLLLPCSVAGLLVVAAACAGVDDRAVADASRRAPPSAGEGRDGTAGPGGGDTLVPDGSATTEGSSPTGTLPGARTEPPVFTEGRRRLVEAGVPDLAAKAYLNASQRITEVHPECKVPPEVLAAFGEQESNHGRVVEWDATGHSLTILRGYATTGPDTDKGELDGDPNADWAVGAMQFIPTTWKAYALDGDGDGKAEPGDFYDSALTAAWHLCDLAGSFPPTSTIAAAWSQYALAVASTEAQFKERHRLWQYRWDRHIYYAFLVLGSPDDAGLRAALRMWPDPGKEPELKPPPLPPVAAQLAGAATRYYGPEGKARDDYVTSVTDHFVALGTKTGDTPYGEQDKVAVLGRRA